MKRLTPFGGAAALIGGVAWLVKGLVIVIGADQPPGMLALVSELVGEVVGVALAISSLTLLVGLLTLGRARPWPGQLAGGSGWRCFPH